MIGLFFGYRYMFVGEDIKDSTVNDVMDSVAKAAEETKNSIKQ